MPVNGTKDKLISAHTLFDAIYRAGRGMRRDGSTDSEILQFIAAISTASLASVLMSVALISLTIVLATTWPFGVRVL
jgi:hypothetical protein